MSSSTHTHTLGTLIYIMSSSIHTHTLGELCYIRSMSLFQPIFLFCYSLHLPFCSLYVGVLCGSASIVRCRRTQPNVLSKLQTHASCKKLIRVIFLLCLWLVETSQQLISQNPGQGQPVWKAKKNG